MDVLAPALAELRAQGYEVLSLSGGEPLFHPELSALQTHAKTLGFRVVGVSNGFRVSERFAELVQGFDGLAISFDGLREVHNRVRGNARAFDAAVSGLRHLSVIGKPSAASFTVSRESLSDIPEFVELAANLGARAVQLRPLVMSGRAIEDYADAGLGSGDLDRVWLIGRALAAGYDGNPFVHTDLDHAQRIAADRDAWATALTGDAEAPLSDLVNPLVITPDGILKPYTFDFPSAFDLGRLGTATQTEVRRRPDRITAIRRLLAESLDAVERLDEFVDWFAFCRDIARQSRRAA